MNTESKRLVFPLKVENASSVLPERYCFNPETNSLSVDGVAMLRKKPRSREEGGAELEEAGGEPTCFLLQPELFV